MNRSSTPEAQSVTTESGFKITQVKRLAGPIVRKWAGVEEAIAALSNLRHESGEFRTYFNIDPVEMFASTKDHLKNSDSFRRGQDLNMLSSNVAEVVYYESAYVRIDRIYGGDSFVVSAYPYYLWHDPLSVDINKRLSETLSRPRALERIDISATPIVIDVSEEVASRDLRESLRDAEDELRPGKWDRTAIHGEDIRKLQNKKDVLLKENDDGIGLYYTVQSSKYGLIGAAQMRDLFNPDSMVPTHHFSVRRALIERYPFGDQNQHTESPIAVTEPNNTRMMERVAQKVVEAFK